MRPLLECPECNGAGEHQDYDDLPATVCRKCRGTGEARVEGDGFLPVASDTPITFAQRLLTVERPAWDCLYQLGLSAAWAQLRQEAQQMRAFLAQQKLADEERAGIQRHIDSLEGCQEAVKARALEVAQELKTVALPRGAA